MWVTKFESGDSHLKQATSNNSDLLRQVEGWWIDMQAMLIGGGYHAVATVQRTMEVPVWWTQKVCMSAMRSL